MWWGDTAATVQYAKINVPRIMETYGAETNAVFRRWFFPVLLR